MPNLERIVLLRHGETVGQSSIRFYGATDIALSGLGADQAAAAARAIGSPPFDLVIASPLHRAWRSALIVAPGQRVLLEPGFREIDFGRFEGLTREEIAARDPEQSAIWEEQGLAYDFPQGERREDFRARVLAGMHRALAHPVSSLLIAAHKGIVRTIAETLSDAVLEKDRPHLGGFVELTRDGDAPWKLTRASD